MNSFRRWAVALGVAFLGLVNSAQAGFLGDTMSVSLTVHTTGALDQVVWSSDPVTATLVGPDITGTSTPSSGNVLAWSLSFTDNSFILEVTNPNASTETVEPLFFSLTGIDGFGPIPGVYIGALNTLGVAGADLSFGPDSISISSLALNSVGPGGTLAVEVIVVPEASTVAMMSLVATGVAGYVIRRRRKNS